MQWLASIWAFIKSAPKLIEFARALWNAVVDFMARREQAARERNLQEAIDQAQKPDKSIEEAADAACKVEKHFNPGSDCDSADRVQ